MTLEVRLEGIDTGKAIDPVFASCRADNHGGQMPAGNRSPAISWTGAPPETKSFAIMTVDRDVPADFSKANKPGEVIPRDAARRAFYHWLLVDIPVGTTALAEGELAGIAGKNSFGERSKGANGYDGPCPPFNDERVHTYHFQVFALDVALLDLKAGFEGEDFERAIESHILDQGEATGLYTTNPHLSVPA